MWLAGGRPPLRRESLGGEEFPLNYRLVARRGLSVCAALLVLALGWWTVAGGVRNLHQAGTSGQQLETGIQLACGLLCFAAVVTRYRWRSLFRRLRIAWVITLSAWVGLSALVWGPPQPLIALVFAVVALLVAWAMLWALGPAPAA